MSQWIGSLQIHDFDQTANRLKEQQQQSTTSSTTAGSEPQPGDKGPTTATTNTAADSEQPVDLAYDVSRQQTSKETDQQPYLDSELNVPFPITDASEQTVKVQSELNLEESKINDTIEHANKTDTNDTCTAQVTSDNDKDYLQTKMNAS